MQMRLTLYEREKIEFYLRHKQKIRWIAKLIGRDHGVVSREIRRNKSPWFPYTATVAQAAADRRAHHTNRTKLSKHIGLKEYVISQLKEGWSPEQIDGRIKTNPPPNLKHLSISYEQIYQYVYSGARDEDGMYLYYWLPKQKPRRQVRYTRKPRKLSIPNRVSIHQRPKDINQRVGYGHWESDTMLCRRRKGISVQYERKSKLVRIHRLVNLKAESTTEAITKSMDTLPLFLFHSITFDNGAENARHIELKDNFNLSTYFCDPYSSWQKGGVENTNGLLRRYLPKGTELDQVTDDELKTIQERLNNRPRKSLQYRTPNEIMREIGALNS